MYLRDFLTRENDGRKFKFINSKTRKPMCREHRVIDCGWITTYINEHGQYADINQILKQDKKYNYIILVIE